jgi:hypothetical protein
LDENRLVSTIPTQLSLLTDLHGLVRAGARTRLI